MGPGGAESNRPSQVGERGELDREEGLVALQESRHVLLLYLRLLSPSLSVLCISI